MQEATAVIAIAGTVFAVWWMLSTRSALKAIQRHLGADPKHAEIREARAYRAQQEAQRRVSRPQV